MTADERLVLTYALSSLSSVELDLHVYKITDRRETYNYDCIGRVAMGKRLLAELIGSPHYHMLPGEYYDDDSSPEELLTFTPTVRSEDGQPLNRKEKEWLQRVVLSTLSHIHGLTDADAGSLRCISRRVAEVSGYPDLGRFSLLYEDQVKPLYLQSYQPLLD